MEQLQQRHAMALTVGATPSMLHQQAAALNQIATAHHLQQVHHLQQLQAGISAALETHRHNAVSSYMVGAQRTFEVAAAAAAQHAALANPFSMSLKLPQQLVTAASNTAGARTLPGVHAPSRHRGESIRATGRNLQVSSGPAVVPQPRHDYLDQMDSRQKRQLDRLAHWSDSQTAG